MLTAEEKIALYRTVAFTLIVDGNLQDRELEFLHWLGRKLGLREEEIKEAKRGIDMDYDVEAALAGLSVEASQEAQREIEAAAREDGAVSPREQGVLDMVAAHIARCRTTSGEQV